MTDLIQRQIDLISTPDGGGDWMASLLRNRPLLLGIARLLAFVGKIWPKPIVFRSKIIVTKHAQIIEALGRDTDFLASQSYQEAIARTNGPFVLAMDRGPQLSHESKALYSALAKFDIHALAERASTEADRLLKESDGKLDAVQDYIWPVCGFTAQSMFGLPHIDPVLFRQASRSIFYHIFLEAKKSPAVEKRAVEAGKLLKIWLADEIGRRRAAGQAHYGTDYMGLLMEDKSLDDDAVRRTIGGILVGSIDTIGGAAARVLALLGLHKKLRQRTIENLQRPAILNSYCREALRLWAPAMLMARRAAYATKLAKTEVNEGDTLLLFTQAAMFDADAFNDPTALRPDRPTSAYLHFGSGVHACAGRSLSDVQIPMLVGKLLARDFRLAGRLSWAGPFPNRLPITLDRN
jgi:cytochrome P450